MRANKKVISIAAAIALMAGGGGWYLTQGDAENPPAAEEFSAGEFTAKAAGRQAPAATPLFFCGNRQDKEGLFQFFTDANFKAGFEDRLCFDALGAANLRPGQDNKINGVINDTGRSFCLFKDRDFKGGGIKIRDQSRIDLAKSAPSFVDSISSISRC